MLRRMQQLCEGSGGPAWRRIMPSGPKNGRQRRIAGNFALLCNKCSDGQPPVRINTAWCACHPQRSIQPLRAHAQPLPSAAPAGREDGRMGARGGRGGGTGGGGVLAGAHWLGEQLAGGAPCRFLSGVHYLQRAAQSVHHLPDCWLHPPLRCRDLQPASQLPEQPRRCTAGSQNK